MTQDQAIAIIDYLETMEGKTNHQSNMKALEEFGYSEADLDAACRALAQIAGRDYSIL